MESINRQIVHQRISLVFDTAMGAQSDNKGITKYVKALRKSVGLKDVGAKGGRDFMRDFGMGI
jgi:hypothetical protein